MPEGDEREDAEKEAEVFGELGESEASEASDECTCAEEGATDSAVTASPSPSLAPVDLAMEIGEEEISLRGMVLLATKALRSVA